MTDEGTRGRADLEALAVEQFTRQAVPFAERPEHSADHANRVLLRAVAADAADDVLDVACGPGLVACELAASARHVTGIDITPAMTEQAAARAGRLGLTNVTWRVQAVPPLPYPDSSFSRVVTRYSFHHLADPAAVFREMVRVCRNDGRVVVADVYSSSPGQGAAYDRMERLRDPSHARALPLAELTGLFADAGLEEVTTDFYRLEMDLEELLASSFPDPGSADEVRRIVRDDIEGGKDRLGIGAYLRDGRMRFSFPVAVLAGRR